MPDRGIFAAAILAFLWVPGADEPLAPEVVGAFPAVRLFADRAPVQVASAHGSISAMVRSDASLRRGVVSMTHGFGAWSGQPDAFATTGVAINRLVSPTDLEPINAMPRFSSIEVAVSPLAG